MTAFKKAHLKTNYKKKEITKKLLILIVRMTKKNRKGFKRGHKKERNYIKIIMLTKISAPNHAKTTIQKVIKILIVLKN